MDVGQAVETLKSLGANLSLEGEEIHIAYRCRSYELPIVRVAIAILKKHKHEAIACLSSKKDIHPVEPCWPSGSHGAVEKFGDWSARLYPFIGRTVRTPKGLGELLQVFRDRATVLLDSERIRLEREQRVSLFDPRDVCPPEVM